MIGDIMRISRLRMGTDGRGVTTLVAFFDCPLHCKYCINDFCHEKENDFETVPRGEYTPAELMRILRKDDIYYKMSGGGVTFGGGEPLLQSAFIHQVCKLADPEWKMRIETSLNVPWRYVEPVINDIDEWIIDIKDSDWDIYKKYTEVSIHNLVENLCRLDDIIDASKVHIRIPCIPGFNNEDNIKESIEWVKRFFDVEPEVFDYQKTQEIKNNKWYECD
ncbi:MAG: radical SAM protein [Ruminococcus sp.]|nr:radical SAM protein [Ruminococcus sp.]